MARRTRKSEEVMNALSEDAEQVSTPDEDSAPSTSSKRAAAKARHVSLKQLAELLDRDRNTIMKWAAQGCPFIEKGDRDLGRAWTFDLAEVVKWREKVSAEYAVEKIGGEKMDEDAWKLRKIAAGTIMLEADAAESVKLVARISDMLDLVRRDYAGLRGSLQGLPDAIAAKVDSKLQHKVRSIALEQLRSALTSLRADKEIDGMQED